VGLPPEQRERELFHLRMLEELSPALARIPFNGAPPRWPGFPSRNSSRIQHYRVLASKVAQELQRRAQAHLARSPDAGDAFTAEALVETRRYALDAPSHPPGTSSTANASSACCRRRRQRSTPAAVATSSASPRS